MRAGVCRVAGVRSGGLHRAGSSQGSRGVVWWAAGVCRLRGLGDFSSRPRVSSGAGGRGFPVGLGASIGSPS